MDPGCTDFANWKESAGYVYKAKAVKVRGAGERMQPRTSAAKEQPVVFLV
jgi:hypothetical protein